MEYQFVFNSLFGPLIAIESNNALIKLKCGYSDISTRTPLLQQVEIQICCYFLGIRRTFNLPIKPRGTDLQKSIWSAISRVSFGFTCSYKEIASELCLSPRSVGIACSLNPIPILIPCHRIISANGKLGGYSYYEGKKQRDIYFHLRILFSNKTYANIKLKRKTSLVDS